MTDPAAPAGGQAAAGVTLVLPAQLRELAGGETSVRLGGRPATVGEALEALRAAHPSAYHRLVTEQGELRPHINLFVGRDRVRSSPGMATPVPDGAEIVVLRSVSGG